MKTKPYHQLTLYETPSRFYLVGSDNVAQSFHVLKIDRTDSSKDLALFEDSHQYTKNELDDLLQMINATVTKTEKSKSKKNSLRSTICRGLIGFVRFLEGYYMILVTKASRVCRLGYHWFYKVEETVMIYIPNEQTKLIDEKRYLRMFQSVDLSTNFYFSFTYDLSRTLSSNIIEPEKGFVAKYIWNNYLLEVLNNQNVSRRFVLPIIHGYLGCCSLSLKNSAINIILVARRSCKFAGTRFLKRGASFQGNVANDVETEQIVFDPTTSAFERGRFTSFVQLRGSVPLFWSQDLTKVVGKPPIQMDLSDPFAVIPALHFRELRDRYGSPIVVISLVKRREKRIHESVLHDEFKSAISYLNQFLDPHEAILYLSFDMARCHKAENVLPKLEEIAYNVIKLTGWFQTFPSLFCHEIRNSPLLEGVKMKSDGNRMLQSGVARTNCVDCLDRTNVAQFVIGKVALAYQLHSLATLEEPVLSWDTEVCRSLELLYEKQGDTLALQYAGSQLVHSIRTYKKTDVFQERMRDVVQTLSRYYNNTFADYDKQNALNLFLGVFRPDNVNKTNLWDLPTDFWLHNSSGGIGTDLDDYCAWFELPEDFSRRNFLPYEISSKVILSSISSAEQATDYDLYYRTYELTSFDAILNSASKLESLLSNSTDGFNHPYKPFWKNQVSFDSDKNSVKEEEENESESSEEEVAHSDFELLWNDQFVEPHLHKKLSRKKISCTPPVAASLCWRGIVPSTKQVYGFDLTNPSYEDVVKYEQFAKFDQRPVLDVGEDRKESVTAKRFARLVEISSGIILKPISVYGIDSFGVTLPEVNEQSVQVYCSSIACSQTGPRLPSAADAKIYSDYVQSLLV